MSNIIYINPYAFAGCTLTAPSSVLIADDDGTDNALSVIFQTIAGPVTLDFAHGATMDISNLFDGDPHPPLAIPILQILATSESSGGDAPTDHAWTLSTTGSAGGSIAGAGETAATTEDIGEPQQFTIQILDLSRGDGKINLDYTGTNCDGSAAASRVTVTVTE